MLKNKKNVLKNKKKCYKKIKKCYIKNNDGKPVLKCLRHSIQLSQQLNQSGTLVTWKKQMGKGLGEVT